MKSKIEAIIEYLEPHIGELLEIKIKDVPLWTIRLFALGERFLFAKDIHNENRTIIIDIDSIDYFAME